MNEETNIISHYPELSGNFENEPSDSDGASALLINARRGNYTVRLSCVPVRSADPSDAWFFLGRRTLAGCIPHFKGALEIKSTIHVGSYIPAGSGRAHHGRLAVTMLAPSLTVADFRIAETDIPTLHIAGDSTVADQPARFPYSPTDCYAGWGQMLPYFLTGKLAVANHAHSGLTTASFRKDGHYGILKNELHRGDYVLMQFGHNDQKLIQLAASGGFRDNLQRYIHELREAGAYPILVTPLARNTWNGSIYNDLLQKHSEAIIALGARVDIPVLDLHSRTIARIATLGATRAASFYREGDYSHTNDCGAFLAARVVVSELQRVCGWRNDDYHGIAEMIEKGTMSDSDPAFLLFEEHRAAYERRLLDREQEKKAEKQDGASKTDGDGAADKDTPPADLSGPATWKTDDDGVLRNPDGSLVPPP